MVVRLDERLVQDPYAVYRELRAGGAVRQVTLPLGLTAWVVTKYDEAKALLADPRLSNQCPGTEISILNPDDSGKAGAATSAISSHMLNSDPPRHTRLRKLLNRAFATGAVQRLRPRIEQITEDLLDEMAVLGEVDLIDAYTFPIPIIVISDLLGVPQSDRTLFRDWSTTIVSPPESGERAGAAAETARYFTELIESKRRDPTDDLFSSLVHTDIDGDRLTDTELVSMAFLLLVAGHETGVNAVANGMYALLRHPEQLTMLREDPTLFDTAFEECLRYDGATHLAIARITKEPVPIAGVVIPEGDYVFISLLGANRDADRFPDPDRLDIRRPLGGHLGFGHGIHKCVGAPLARLEAEIAFTRLLARFPKIELAAPPEELRWRNNTLIRGLHTLPVRLG